MPDSSNKTKVAQLNMKDAQLVLLRGIADALMTNKKIEDVLEDLLFKCITAAGILKGVLYLFDINGKSLSQQVLGYKKIDEKRLANFFTQSNMLTDICLNKKIVQVPSSEFSDDINQQLLYDPALTYVLLVPMTGGEQCYGVLLLGFHETDITQSDALLFATTLGSQIGQALALSTAFAQVVSSEQRYRLLMDNANCGFFVTNHQGIILEVNKYAEKLLNCSKKQIINQHFRTFIAPSDLPTATHQFNKLTQEGVLDVSEIQMQPVGGAKPRTVFYTSTAVKTPTETLLLLTVTDITEVHHLKSEAIRKKREYDQKIKVLLFTDQLTGLNNRFTFLENLSSVVRDAEKKQMSFAVVHIDLVHFNKINNALGRDAGDHVLKHVADCLSTIINNKKMLGRLFANTFAIILPNLKESDAPLFLKNLMHTIKKPLQVKNKKIYIKACIGVSFYPLHGKTSDELMKHANAALLHSKELGGDNYQFYQTSMKEPTHATLELEADLNQALSRKEFEIYYQPIVSVLSEKIVGIEALLRWNHPIHGLLSPATFIPICEANGLIIPIGQWVLNTACLQMKEWYDQGYVDLHVAVNLSARQFNDPELLKIILQVLETTKLPPHCLELELTESVIVQNPKKNAAILTALQNLGVQLAMDDFGTGYSSLSYFKKFKFNTLKIDKSFIDDLAISYISEAIVAAIISLGKSVGLTVLAEGVEKAEQLDLLKKYECDFLQGYLFSKPLPVDKITAMLKNESGE